MRLAREIDSIAETQDNPRVLSIACGHLREAELSVAVREGRARMTALDQDPESIARVARDYGSFNVTTIVGTVVDVLRRRLKVRDVALAYAAGLYDYLDTELAAALTEALFRMLAPQGPLLIANFTPDTRDAAFMEACMDWHLIYRDERQLVELTRRI